MLFKQEVLRAFSRAGEDGEQNRRENGDDGDNYEELDQSERGLGGVFQGFLIRMEAKILS